MSLSGSVGGDFHTFRIVVTCHFPGSSTGHVCNLTGYSKFHLNLSCGILPVSLYGEQHGLRFILQTPYQESWNPLCESKLSTKRCCSMGVCTVLL